MFEASVERLPHGPHDCCGRTPWPLPRCSCARRPSTTHRGASRPRCERGARARRLLRGADDVAARVTIVQLDNLTARSASSRSGRATPGLGGAGGRRGAGDQRPGATRPRAGAPGHRRAYSWASPASGRDTWRPSSICIEQGLRAREAVVRGNLGTFAYFAGRWTEAAQWYSDGAGGRDGGGKRLRRRRDGRQPRRAPHQPGSPRRGGAASHRCRARAAGLRRRAVPRAG